MGEGPTSSGWLPPRAPDGAEPPPERSVSPVSGTGAPPGSVGAGDAGQSYGASRPPSSRVAVTGTVLGVTGIVLLVMSVGVSLWLSTLLGTAALLCSITARKRIEAGIPGRPQQVRTARIVGIVTLALSLIAGITWLILINGGYTPADLQNDLLDWMERMRARESG